MNNELDPKKLKRPRIGSVLKGDAIIDPLGYQKNLSSEQARSIEQILESISIEIWFDKHYIYRDTVGDEDGKRDGINQETVKNLIIESMSHLLFYSNMGKIYFVNYNIGNTNEHAVRIICQKEINNEMLNVVIEVHAYELGRYEATIKTAMKTDNFKLSEGQYAIQMIDKTQSILRQLKNRSVIKLMEI